MKLAQFQRPDVFSWSPFDQLNTLRDEINRLYDTPYQNGGSNPLNGRDQRADRPQRPNWLQPSVNIVETPDAFVLEAEMPGVSKEALDILVEGSELTIVGRRSVTDSKAQLLYRESYECDFRRSFELDPTIDTARISARMENGVLYLELPKAEKMKPRKIAVE